MLFFLNIYFGLNDIWYARTPRTPDFYFYFGKRGHCTTREKLCPRFSEKNAESMVRGVRAYGGCAGVGADPPVCNSPPLFMRPVL